MGRIINASLIFFFSFILGAVMLAVVAVQFSDTMETLLTTGGWVTDMIGDTGLDPKYNVWVKFLVSEQQIVFLGFVILARIILAMVFGAIGNLLGIGNGYR